MRLIIVTRVIDGAKMYVNPENVCAVYQYYKKDTTIIQFVGAEENYLKVLESADSVANMMEM